MVILVVGSGAREHALADACAREGARVLCAPGNAGTAAVARNLDVPVADVDGLVRVAREHAVDLVVVGPELPLTLGLVDRLEEAGIAAFGPSRAAARLEGSKSFMKDFLKRHGIPTAPHVVFDDADRAEAHLRSAAGGRHLVVKADGLAGGKGVVVAADVEEAARAVDRLMRERAHGEAGARVVLEERLPGQEASFHVVSDGTRFVTLAAAQDHKRLLDGDAGPNTGGMGAYAPAPIVDEALEARVVREVIEPTLRGMSAEGTPFRGALFVGLMIEAGTPRVLEFNVRFGDPETSVLVPTYGGSWLELLRGAATGRIERPAVRSRGAALAVVLAAHGYPDAPRAGDLIELPEEPLDPRIRVYHAGTRRDRSRLLTAGGRVLNVVGQGDTLHEAAERAYSMVHRIRFAGCRWRADIGGRAGVGALTSSC